MLIFNPLCLSNIKTNNIRILGNKDLFLIYSLVIIKHLILYSVTFLTKSIINLLYLKLYYFQKRIF